MKKELNTSLEIVYDLEIVSFHNGSKETEVELLATCEEGSETFTLSAPHNGEPYTEHDINDIITDLDLSTIEKWVDSTTVSFIASEVSNICVNKSDNTQYYKFSVDTLNLVMVSILVFERFGRGIGKVISTYNATGEEQIKELLNKLK